MFLHSLWVDCNCPGICIYCDLCLLQISHHNPVFGIQCGASYVLMSVVAMTMVIGWKLGLMVQMGTILESQAGMYKTTSACTLLL